MKTTMNESEVSEPPSLAALAFRVYQFLATAEKEHDLKSRKEPLKVGRLKKDGTLMTGDEQWWSEVKDSSIWSGAIVGIEWNDLWDDARREIQRLYDITRRVSSNAVNDVSIL